MLIFENLGAFKAIHECAKQLYPEITLVPVVIELSESVTRVVVLEGTDEDTGKYKIVLKIVPDKSLNEHNFTVGLAQVIFRVKYGVYVLDALRGELKGESANAAKNYNLIIDSITEKLNNTMYINNLICE